MNVLVRQRLASAGEEHHILALLMRQDQIAQTQAQRIWRLSARQLEDGTPVEEGVRVKKGQRIALLEDREYRAALAAAEAGLQAAEATLVDATREYNRAKALFEDGTATAQERDTAQAAFERAEASVAQAKAQRETAQISLDETVLVAPMDGRFT